MTTERKKVSVTVGLLQLRALLKERKKKQLEFGEEVGIPQSAISEILNEWRLPTLEQAVKLEGQGIPVSAWTELPKEESGAA